MSNKSFKPRILIADDDPDIRSILSAAVESINSVEFQLASDGREAQQILSEHDFDLLILDIMMPHRYGLDICKEFKQSPAGKLVPVLIVTAKDTVQDKVGAFDDGADDYITKPFNFSELQARVRALLRVREMNLKLQEKTEELKLLQDQLVEQERQLAVTQLAGTAAHTLGQPLSAILLNMHLLKEFEQSDKKWDQAYNSVKLDLSRAIELVNRLKNSKADQPINYGEELTILQLNRTAKYT